MPAVTAGELRAGQGPSGDILHVGAGDAARLRGAPRHRVPLDDSDTRGAPSGAQGSAVGGGALVEWGPLVLMSVVRPAGPRVLQPGEAAPGALAGPHVEQVVALWAPSPAAASSLPLLTWDLWERCSRETQGPMETGPKAPTSCAPVLGSEGPSPRRQPSDPRTRPHRSWAKLGVLEHLRPVVAFHGASHSTLTLPTCHSHHRNSGLCLC